MIRVRRRNRKCHIHGLGAALAIAGTAVMIVFSSRSSNTIDIVSASIYGFSLIFYI